MEKVSSTANGKPLRDPSEKRSCPRYPFSPTVEAHDIQANTRIMGRLSDIARNGCYMDTICPFAPKAAVALTITKDTGSFKTQAKVVYSQVGMGMGLLFTTAEPEQLRQLGMWLGELEGANPGKGTVSNVNLEPSVDSSSDLEIRRIVSDLVAILSVKKILNDSEGMNLLRKLSR